MKILIFNNRCIKNPESGGAEVFTHQIAKRWVRTNHKVTLVVSNFKRAHKKEIIDGVEIVRVGNKYTYYFFVKKYYKKYLQGKFDIVVDEYTLRPIMAKNFSKEPVFFLVHELAREKYFSELFFPVNYIFYYYLEPKWIRNYSKIPAIAVSNSTKEDLQNYGFKDVYIVPEGIDFKPVEKIPKKEKNPTILFVGLLKKTNLVDHAIKAFKIINLRFPNSRLWIVGKGPELEKLKNISKNLNVTYFGYVSNEKKLDLMRRAHLLLVPAIREGWCLVVTEANACGTPAIGYNVPGLRDSIRHKKTGILTNCNPKALAKASIDLLKDKNKRNLISKNALEWSKNFSWDNTAEEIMNVFNNVLKK